jgi:acetolactate decarboxylase
MVIQYLSELRRMLVKCLKIRLCIGLFVISSIGCNKVITHNQESNHTTNQSPARVKLESLTPSVTINGALREIMHMGRTQRRVDLAPLINQKGLFGLGALENLSGEVTLWDGQLWLSTPDDNGGAVAGQHAATTDGATLLVTSVVTKWQKRTVTEAVSFAALDDYIEREARAAGVNVKEPFPFRIEGTPSRLDWHVIDGSKIPTNAHGHEAHIRTAIKGNLNGKAVRIIGFYSPKHHTIFTHHNTNTHAHVISMDSAVTGHVDHLTLNEGAQIFFPTR